MLTVIIIENNTMYCVQKLNLFLCLFSCSAKVILANFTSYLFLYILQPIYPLIFFDTFNYRSLNTHTISHDLSHSHTQLLGFQINPLSQVPLSINCLHSHLHLSSIHLCLLLQTLASSLHLHLQV